jgi:hypothetical protein
MTVRERLAEIDEDLLLADGFDDAIIGVGYRCSRPPVVVYDRQKCIEKLVAEGMSIDEAEEFFEFNVVGAWVGEQTPIFVARLERE